MNFDKNICWSQQGKEYANSMDVIEENMWVMLNEHTHNWLDLLCSIWPFSVMCMCRSPKEMLEKIAELEYSQSLLRDQNADMSKLLDGADDDMAALGSENKSLRKQVET